MENFDEIPFSRIFGTERRDIFLIESEFAGNNNQVEVTNKKREEIKKIGFDWLMNNHMSLEEFDVNLLHINRTPDRTPADFWRFQLSYGKNHSPPIIKVEIEKALVFTRKSGISRITIHREFLSPRLLEILEEIDSMSFIGRILQNERLYDPSKYQISNLKRDKVSREIKSIMVNIEESIDTTFTPFVKIEDFERLDNPLVCINPRCRDDLGVLGGCRVKLLLHFSHFAVINSQYNLVIYVKKCGFE